MPVEGTVTLNGKPLANATVVLDPRSATQIVYKAVTDDAGRYLIAELESGRTGAPPGNYRVTITTARPLTEGKIDESTKFSPELVPLRYRDGSVTIDIPAEGNTAANFDLQPR